MSEWNPNKPLDLGILDEFDTQPPPEKKKKSLPLKLKKTVDVCSNQHFTSPKKGLETYQQSFCPQNTKINTRWAVKKFVDWAAPVTMNAILVRKSFRGTASYRMQCVSTQQA